MSIAKSKPPSKRKIPNTRYQLMNEALRSGASLSNRCDPQILAAFSGEVTTNIPSATVTALTKAFASGSPVKSAARYPILVFRNVCAIPPAAAESLE